MKIELTYGVPITSKPSQPAGRSDSNMNNKSWVFEYSKIVIFTSRRFAGDQCNLDCMEFLGTGVVGLACRCWLTIGHLSHLR